MLKYSYKNYIIAKFITMLHIEDTKKAVVFTDIKDFTLKNSLFTQLQIRKLLNIQD
ncbi:MAG: hypothetical protein LBQ24_03775 [Candidatus Peribacteria bacterium]|jgi:hypothetical protein|nr:hypothetical protein [Candidatus Peribacteria bacterium]